MTTRGVPWERLDDLVPDELDDYWQLTLRFLQDRARALAGDACRARRRSSRPTRRDPLIAAEAARLARKTDAPVIAAGSTGSMPATAELLATIAQLPHGAVVLPGLDTDLDDASWKLIAGDENKRIAPASGHPQFAMQALLTRIGIARDAVDTLWPQPHGRERLLSEALRPAAATDLWRQARRRAGFRRACRRRARHAHRDRGRQRRGGSARHRGRAARGGRHAGKTAALVTPDRALARRVLAALARWNIAVDDSGGDALADTPAGVFARLAAEAALDGLAPVTLLALLKHPLLRLGMRRHARTPSPRWSARSCAARGRRAGHAPGLAARARNIPRDERDRPASHPIRARDLTDADLAAAAALVDAARRRRWRRSKDLGRAPLPLAATRRAPSRRDRRTVAAMATTRSHSPGATARRSPTRSTTSRRATPPPASRSRRPTIPSCFAPRSPTASCAAPARPACACASSARSKRACTDSDRVVLGGLIEGTWPPETRSDPWLSRPMRLELGLDLPERRIGLSAHDFAQTARRAAR